MPHCDEFLLYPRARGNAIPVRVYTDAVEVLQILRTDFDERRARGEKVLLFSDIDETVIESGRGDDLRQRPLGAALARMVCEYERGHVAFVTARMWENPQQKTMTSRAWLSTFFDLYVNDLHPVVDQNKNSVVLCDPPPRRMKPQEIDLHVEMYKQRQRGEWAASKYASLGKTIWTCVGDNVWDILGSSSDNPLSVDCERLFHHKLFGKAFFLFGDGVSKMAPTSCSRFGLLLSSSSRPKLNERKDALLEAPAPTPRRRSPPAVPHATPEPVEPKRAPKRVVPDSTAQALSSRLAADGGAADGGRPKRRPRTKTAPP